MSAAHPIVYFNVGGTPHAVLKKTFPVDSIFHKWFVLQTKPIPFPIDKNGNYFVDRDPFSFGVILNYFRLSMSGCMWETCLPKDPDRLALLTQEADFFQLPTLRDQAVSLLQSCSGKNDTAYVNEVLAKSTSFPLGFDRRNFDDDY